MQSYPLDTKQYRYVELDNGIKTLLVSDSSAVKSLASLSVQVGSFHDPEEWEGLAHFLEHLLFLGTEKYPDSDDYNKFLDANGGSHNAYTAYDVTNYHFSVDSNAYDGALDRFAQFFIAPLFTEKYVQREKNAVHSEYFTRIERDGIRYFEILEKNLNPNHPAYKFNVGNLETLSDKPDQKARDVLIDFYNTWYSADIMTLALVSNHSLDDLETLARKKFSAISVIHDRPELDYPPLFTAGELPKVIEIKPVQDSRSLQLIFPLPLQERFKAENPVGFVASMMVSEGDDSLSDRLKSKGWINGIQASPGANYGGNDTLTIRVSLTEKGSQYQDDIIAALFDQIALVKQEGVAEWRYREIQNLSELSFRFSENQSLGLEQTITLANALSDTLPRYLVAPGYRRFDKALIDNVLAELRPDNMLVVYASPEVVPEQKTEFYQAEFRVYKADAKRLALWQQPFYNNLKLAEPNVLIPENFDLEKIASAKKPGKLPNTDGVELWYFPNIEDGIPRATVQLAIDRPQRFSLEQSIASQLYFQLINEQIQDLSYNARRAGMRYQVSAEGITFSGYSDKLAQLSEQVLAKVLVPEFTEQQFQRMAERIQRYFKNYNKVGPASGVGRDLDNLLDGDSYSIEEIRNVVESITLQQVLDAPQWIYGEGQLQMLVSGNIDESEARQFAERIRTRLGLEVSDKEPVRGSRVVRLEPNHQSRDIYTSELDHSDAAVLRYYQGRNSSREERIYLNLISQIAHQAYFNDLRTEQQLGYIVSARYKRADRMPGLAFLVQSPSADANQVEAATDQFLLDFEQQLAEMSEAELAPLIQASIAQLAKPAQNLREKTSRFWQDLRDGFPEFDSREKSITALEATTMGDLQKAYKSVVLEKPRAISVIAPGAKGGVKGTVSGFEEFRDGKKLIIRN
ncbi:insulinase family protein [bacterium SCSIO 12696]|nr:insulinase family protein [bacterium SCSIO 12696]